MGKLLSVLVLVLGFHCVNGQDGIPSAPINLMGSTTATSITLTWEHLGGPEVDSYDINYSYILNECSSVRNEPVIVTLSNSSQMSYTVENGPDTPVEEHSMYSISLTARNSVGRSPASNVWVTTPEAAPGIPEGLQTVSVSVTNITIQWDRVNCRDRNGRINSYRIVYYPSSNPSNQVAQTVVGTGDNDRMFDLIGQPPRTSYTFEVQASNIHIDVRGDPAFYIANTTAPQDLGFLLSGQLYHNNSIVTVTDIGTSTGPGLYCLTPSLECCSASETPNAASVTREWYLPDGRPVTSDSSPFIRSRVSSAVSLHRNPFNSVISGVYRCEIPDASGTSQNIYVGIYPQGDGSPSITSLLFDRNSTTLTCTSTGGPPTTVTWKKDGQPVNETLYEQSQRLVDAERATYENVLFNAEVANFVGTFTCEVSNVRSTIQETTELNGVSTVRDQLNVGASATASCFSDAPATRMEWLHNGVVVASDTSTQRLDLVFSPVNDSIHNQVYVCRVTRDGGAQAEQSFTAIVDVPPNAIVASVSSSGSARAGMAYNLTCNVFKTVTGLINSPTATWTDVSTGMAISDENGITVSTATDDMMSSSVLTFDPLQTSHEGSFVCSGTLTSTALETVLMQSTMEELNVQISTPDVVITVPSDPLFAGSVTPLTLTCTISINAATDTDVTITDADITWFRGSSRLSNSDARVTISVVSGSRPSFISTLTLDPLSTADNTTFTCRARARPPPNVPSFVIASEMGEGIMSVVVILPSPPTVSVNPFNSLEIAGQPLTLNCSASIQEGIRGTPVLTWTREDDSLSSDVTSAPPLLSFHSLRTSHAGRYTCTARLYISEAGVDVQGTNTTTVMVEIPQPSVTISSSPGNNMTFVIGLALTFSCVVVVHPAVDTGMVVQGNWERNGTQLQSSDDGRISINNNFMETSSSSNIFQITAMINSMKFDDSGTYSCSATVTQQGSNNFVVLPQSPTENQRAISVQDFPSPDIDVALQQPSTDGCGEARILNCTSKLGEDFTPAPTIIWIGPDDSPVSTDDSANPRINTESSQLIFSDITAANSGPYKCHVRVGNDTGAITSIMAGTTFPGMPHNASCSARSGGSTLSLSWKAPTNSQSGIVGYQVEVEELRHRSGTREVEEVSIKEFFTETREVIITQGLASRIPYKISVRALNLAGCGEEREISCFTQEGIPLSPENVEVIKLNRTSIKIRWKKLTLVELQGLANYNVTYGALSPSGTWQTIILPWSEYSAVVRNLNPGTQYRILVSVSTTAGEAGPVQVDYHLPLDTDSTTDLPGIDSEPTNIAYAAVGVVIAVLFVLIILTTFVVIVFLIIRRRRAKLEFEKNRMLRAFDQPTGIMLTKQERQSRDMDKEEEAAALEEKPPSSPTDECELVQSPVHIPVTFGTTSPQKESTKAEDSALNANGSELKQP